MAEQYEVDQSASRVSRPDIVIREEITIINELGLHARLAAEFVLAAKAFRSQIWLVKGEERFSASSVLEVLCANLNCGDTAIIEADGRDAEEAVKRLAELIREFGKRDSEGPALGRRRVEEGDSMPPPLRKLLLPLLFEVAASPYLIADSIGMWHMGEERFWMPRFIFQRTQRMKRRIKVGLFAGIHGDEPEAVLGLVDLVRALNSRPEVGRDYQLFIYPMCNPSGLADGTRSSRSGVDLNRQFWQNSAEPEVRLLEAEIRDQKFEGIISLHTDDTSDGVYGFAYYGTETNDLLHDALQTAHHALPRCRSTLIDGFPANNAIVRECYGGVLSAPPEQQPWPWEIILETPQREPEQLQRQAFVLAVAMILARYRTQTS
jgi:phosphotransferase system HPr (HPr) family protein